MERVLIKVHEVQLRLKEDVEIQIVIKKGSEAFIIPRKAKLSKGKAVLGAHAEFFVSSKNPAFDINVNIIHGSAKRFAGMCQVDLSEWEQYSSNSTTCLLEKSPDTKAKIMFDFMFMSSDVNKPNKGLISQSQLSSERRLDLIKGAEEKNIVLANENKQLMEEAMIMKKKNRDLLINQKQMAEEIAKKSLDDENIYKMKCEQIKSSENSLQLMKEKVMKLEEMINRQGSPEMKEKMLALQSLFTKAQ